MPPTHAAKLTNLVHRRAKCFCKLSILSIYSGQFTVYACFSSFDNADYFPLLFVLFYFLLRLEHLKTDL